MFDFKNRLKKLRKNLQLRQQDMAEDLSVPFTTISKYELGLIRPGTEILSKIGNRYNVNLNWLLNGTGEMFRLPEYLVSTGTYGKPHVKLIKNGQCVCVEKTDVMVSSEFKGIENDLDELNSEASLLKYSKRMNIPIISEVFENNKKVGIKIFKPDGSIENQSSCSCNQEKSVVINNKLNTILEKLQKFSNNVDKLIFLELAINSLEDKSALNELKTLIKGMELANNG